MSTSARWFVLAAVLFAPFAAQAATPPVVGFAQTSYTFPETALTMPIAFARSGSLDGDVSIKFSIRWFGGAFVTKVITFPAGLTTVYHDLTDDTYWDLTTVDQTYTMQIDSAEGATIGQSTASLTIKNVPNPVKISVDNVSVNEGGGPPPLHATFTVKISGGEPQHGTGNLQFVTHDETAHGGADYLAQSGSVPIYYNTQSVTIDVPIFDDGVPEGDETFTLELTNPQILGYTGGPVIARCTIVDDDSAIGPSPLRIPAGGKGQIKIDFTEPAAAPEQVTFSADPNIVSLPSAVTIPAGTSSTTVDVTAVSVGTTTILATAPPSRGGRQFALAAAVYQPTDFSFDRLNVAVEPGSNATVTATLKPAPATPLTLPIINSSPAVASMANALTIGTDGTGTLTVHGNAAGAASVQVTLPETLGAGTAFVVVNVVVPNGLAITSMSKSTGRASGNERVQLFGNNFSGRCVVLFGGVPAADVAPASSGSIFVTTPPHDPGIVDVTIKCGTDTNTFHNGFGYTAAPLKLTQVAPVSGTTSGGTTIRLTGQNVRAGCEAWFGNVPARTIASTLDTALTVIAPKHDAGDVSVTLRCGNESSSLANAFSFFAADDPPPTITSLTPSSVQAGDRISLIGSRFRPDDTVTIGGVPALSEVQAPDTRLVVVPELATGSAAVALRDAAGHTATGLSITMGINFPPSVTAMAAKIPAGAELVITGLRLRRGLKYAIGSTPLTPLAFTAADATLGVPVNTPIGVSQLIITDGVQPPITRTIEVVASGVRVSAVAPPCSADTGGALVTVRGTGFESGAVVRFGNAYSADAVVADANTILARVPPSFGALQPVITVFNRSGSSATLTNAFAYVSPHDACGGGRQHGARR